MTLVWIKIGEGNLKKYRGISLCIADWDNGWALITVPAGLTEEKEK